MLLRDRLWYLICALASLSLFVYLQSHAAGDEHSIWQLVVKILPPMLLFWLCSMLLPSIKAWYMALLCLCLWLGIKSLQYLQDYINPALIHKSARIFFITNDWTVTELIAVLSGLFICVRVRKSILDRN